MHSRNRINILLLAFVVVLTSLSVAAVNWVYHTTVVEKLERIEQKEKSLMITTQWRSGGEVRTWTSKWKEYDENEDFDDFIDRHIAEVAAAKVKLPKDPPE